MKRTIRIILSLIVFYASSEISMQAQYPGSEYINQTNIYPLVVREGMDYFTIEIGVNDPSIISIEMYYTGLGYIEKYKPWPEDNEFTLYDDGNNGDKIAGDKIFTSDSITAFCPYCPVSPVQEWAPNSKLTFEFSDGSNKISYDYLDITIRTIDPSIVPLPTIRQIAPDVFSSDYVVNVVLTDVLGDYPNQYLGDISRNPSYPERALFQRYYDLFPDDRDFLIRQVDGELAPSYAYFDLVSNETQGIGLSTFSRAGEHGSSGKLQGIIHQGLKANNFQTYNHEILHRWATYLDQSIGLTNYNVHWSYIERPSTGYGRAGSFVTPQIQEESDGNYLWLIDSTSNFLAYNDLELYLMGLVGPQEVANPIRALVNRSQLNGDDIIQIDGNYYYSTTADELIQVELSDIINFHGPRLPDHTETQKSFTMAYLVPSDRPLTEIEFAFFDYMMREYRKPSSTLGLTFEAATGGKATMETCINGTCPEPPRPNNTPIVNISINDVELQLGKDSFTQDLSLVFSDPDGDDLTYSASINNEAIASTTVSGNILTVTALAAGDATITVNADDGRGGTVHDAFDLTVSTGVAVEQTKEDLPNKFTLEQNYPNPFNQTTIITFTLSQASSVLLKVYDLMGGDVTILISGDYQVGRHEVTWNASEYLSGVYIYQMQTGTDVERRKMLLLR